jgi:phosphoserine phosphatase
MVKAWLAAAGIAREDAHIRFYSDSRTDSPCMDWADEAFATSPHAPLRALAAERGWPVFEWKAGR